MSIWSLGMRHAMSQHAESKLEVEERVFGSPQLEYRFNVPRVRTVFL